jgi:hypothetical protein
MATLRGSISGSAADSVGSRSKMRSCRATRTPIRRRYERAALRWLQRFLDERLPPLTEVTLGFIGSR